MRVISVKSVLKKDGNVVICSQYETHWCHDTLSQFQESAQMLIQNVSGVIDQFIGSLGETLIEMSIQVSFVIACLE